MIVCENNLSLCRKAKISKAEKRSPWYVVFQCVEKREHTKAINKKCVGTLMDKMEEKRFEILSKKLDLLLASIGEINVRLKVLEFINQDKINELKAKNLEDSINELFNELDKIKI